MRICPRCSKRISDDRAICRDCGGILEEVPDDELPTEPSPSRSPSHSEEEPPDDEESRPEQTGDALNADELSFAELGTRQLGEAEDMEWKCDQCGSMVPGTFDLCWNCAGIEDPDSQRERDDVPAESMACPFCGDQMIGGHIWVSGGDGVSNLEWQAGSQLESGLFGKSVDETLLSDGFFVAPAKQAFRCSSCGALLTRFEDPT